MIRAWCLFVSVCAAGALAACGPALPADYVVEDIDDFIGQYSAMYCERVMECYDEASRPWDTVDTCAPDIAEEHSEYSSCDVTQEAATACFDEVNTIPCADFVSGSWMDACRDPWDCPWD